MDLPLYHPRERVLAILAIGLCTAVLMWTVGYVTHLPLGLAGPVGHMPDAPPEPVTLSGGPVTFLLLVLAAIAGGIVLGQRGRFTLSTAAWGGVVAGLINLLIIGSIVRSSADDPLRPMALIWVPGSVLAHAGLLMLGHVIGARLRRPPLDWMAWRTGVYLGLCVATLLVVAAGGFVTSTGSGLDVPDWPATFGTNMFLYPLAQMTGGIYYEHAHRLYGSLVGLASIIAMCVAIATDHRRIVRWSAVGLFLFICVQGVVGGQWRVVLTDLSAAVIHGVGGQMILALAAGFAAVSSAAWLKSRRGEAPEGGPAGDRTAVNLLVIALVVQLYFGAMYRHFKTPEEVLPWPAHAHLAFSVVVLLIAIAAGARLWGRYAHDQALRRSGAAILILITLQFVLGFAALLAVLAWKGEPYTVQVLMTTAHQVNGALLLVAALQGALWVRRYPVAEEAPSAALA